MADSAAEVITVANIEDLQEIREGLAMLIDGTPGFRCIGKYRSMVEGARLTRLLVRDNCRRAPLPVLQNLRSSARL